MMGKNHLSRAVLCAAGVLALLSAGPASASVFNMPAGQTSLQFVPVGNAGNASDSRIMSDGTSGYGAVDYDFRMGQYMVTIGQYTQFLNAVAATDTYGLYNTSMATDAAIAGIARSGDPGSYTYSPIGSPNRPIAYVNWGDATRFSNWLTNGQPTGPQGPGTTETGSYALNGATTDAALMAVTRIADQDRVPGSKYYFIPTENEWYKAAYYDPATTDYFLYPTGSNDAPTAEPPPGGANSANYGGSGVAGGVTDVGAYALSGSPYGTFDQAGNLWEWNEAIIGSNRGQRGGPWGGIESFLRATTRHSTNPTVESRFIGFRVSEVPEPATAVLLALGGVVMLRRRKRFA